MVPQQHTAWDQPHIMPDMRYVRWAVQRTRRQPSSCQTAHIGSYASEGVLGVRQALMKATAAPTRDSDASNSPTTTEPSNPDIELGAWPNPATASPIPATMKTLTRSISKPNKISQIRRRGFRPATRSSVSSTASSHDFVNLLDRLLTRPYCRWFRGIVATP